MVWKKHVLSLGDFLHTGMTETRIMAPRKQQPPQDPPKESINDLAVTDARRLSLPVVTIISIISFFAWLTWTAANERSNIQTKLDKMDDMITMIQAKDQSLFDILKKHEERSKETWSEKDHMVWCLKAQLLNKGWLCPDLDSSKFIQNGDSGWHPAPTPITPIPTPPVVLPKKK